MENNELRIEFIKENEAMTIDIMKPEFSDLIHNIVSRNLCVSEENIQINTTNEEFDVEEFLEILVTVYEEFSEEIQKFFDNTKKELTTYYSYDNLSEKIISEIKNIEDTSLEEMKVKSIVEMDE